MGGSRSGASRWPGDSGGSEVSLRTPRTGSGSGSTPASSTGSTTIAAHTAPIQILIVLCRERRAATDPPRFCSDCGRKLAVQVLPTGFTARCVRCGPR